MDKQTLGKKGELLVIHLYKKDGHKILGTNLYTPFGEIDILTKKNRVIHIIEVKTRTRSHRPSTIGHRPFTSPLRSWFNTQRIRLSNSVRYLLAINQLTSTENLTCEFILIELSGSNKVRCKRFKNIPLNL
jgi:Holliday junction resolvase-like predicted endonuclease